MLRCAAAVLSPHPPTTATPDPPSQNWRTPTTTRTRCAWSILALALSVSLLVWPLPSHGQTTALDLRSGEQQLVQCASDHLTFAPVNARSAQVRCTTADYTPPPVAPTPSVKQAFFYNTPRAPLTVANIAQRADWIVGHGKGCAMVTSYAPLATRAVSCAT